MPNVPRVPGGEPTTACPVVALSKGPKTLHDLWDEWIFGTGDRKPASTFTSHERGTVKSVFSFRLVFWKKIDEMVRSGMTANLACDEVYAAYGRRQSVTVILRDMKRDALAVEKKTGDWPPALRASHPNTLMVTTAIETAVRMRKCSASQEALVALIGDVLYMLVLY